MFVALTEDQSATAKRAFQATMQILDGLFNPVLAATFLPMLTLATIPRWLARSSKCARAECDQRG
ncbi:hypothetical protein NXT3_PB00335 (plasmid) [Sinorhizobium fredii]|uniref:Uncharacterized protein n=1 Tax=Rhizobium fredii TaxID=380 RepID=A0A2L0HBW7_RHIFR|nr:hypothetical protein NXT3_PB00335 [Sinorhizobium fredii]